MLCMHVGNNYIYTIAALACTELLWNVQSRKHMQTRNLASLHARDGTFDWQIHEKQKHVPHGAYISATPELTHDKDLEHGWRRIR